MVETKKDAAPAAAAAATTTTTTTVAEPRKSKRHPDKKKLNRRSLGCGMYKYGLKKRNVWTFVGKRAPKKKKRPVKPVEGEKAAEKPVEGEKAAEKPVEGEKAAEKPVEGEKAAEKPVEGKKKDVKQLTKSKSKVKYPRFYPTMDKVRKHKYRNTKHNPKHKLRASLVPGKVVIILTGVHKCCRAIFLKQLKSGLLLVTGPRALNAVPVCRVNKKHVIATSTQLDISNVEIPSHIDDAYFKRVKPKKLKKKDGNIFAVKKEKEKVSEKRIVDQKIVDKQMFDVIKKLPNQKMIRTYLCTQFALKNKMYPHNLKF